MQIATFQGHDEGLVRGRIYDLATIGFEHNHMTLGAFWLLGDESEHNYVFYCVHIDSTSVGPNVSFLDGVYQHRFHASAILPIMILPKKKICPMDLIFAGSIENVAPSKLDQLYNIYRQRTENSLQKAVEKAGLDLNQRLRLVAIQELANAFAEHIQQSEEPYDF